MKNKNKNEVIIENTEVQQPFMVAVKNYIVKGLWKDLLISAGMALLMIKFVAFTVVIPTGSMLPTLEIGNKYFAAKYTTYFDENKGLVHGDLAIFTNEEVTDDLMVKRVIGLPGDTISIEDGVVFRNGEALVEDYVKNVDRWFNLNEFQVPAGEFFLLGDNRQDSLDSRFWETTTIPLSNVVAELKL